MREREENGCLCERKRGERKPGEKYHTAGSISDVENEQCFCFVSIFDCANERNCGLREFTPVGIDNEAVALCPLGKEK